MIKRSDIQIRDPFILPVKEEKKYYLYGTTDKNCWGDKGVGFDAYYSSDLENWEGPFEVFRPDEGFWADRNFWAPEVHYYKGKYYMFASFKAEGLCRGTQILASDSPLGPFKIHSDGPVTPKEWECLDGTLYVDDKGDPWMAFCREWLQVYDGEMYAVKLTKDLSSAVEDPILLFHASESSWSQGRIHTFNSGDAAENKKIYVTDGPFIYRTVNGQLLMLWSSSGKEGYTMGIARSATGNIAGPWTHDSEPLYGKDGGHGMIFRTFENNLMLTIHTPNKTPRERPVFLNIHEKEDRLLLIRIPKAPLFRDPIYDGAADPIIIWNREEKSWWLLYTNRRANITCDGVSWVHGTDIGIASSSDGGQNWLYRGTVNGLEFEKGRNTFWAPEIIWHEGTYHMYMSYVKGIPTDWNWERHIIHYTSNNLWDWKFEAVLKLSSNKVIDACVFQLPNGIWRMWYKDEANGSHTYAADSRDLYNWEVAGPVITDLSHEGPNVFYWKDKYWMICDYWKGLMVYKSEDGISWVRQGDILDKPGRRKDDGAFGQHADILIHEDNAYIFYFTHPGARSDEKPDGNWSYERKRTSLQVAKLELDGDELVCHRNKPFDFYLL